MQYKFDNWTIRDLIKLYTTNKLDLNPPYQRNDIWTNPLKRRLIDSIKSNYPLPIFFLYKNNDGLYEMVDGQQRTRAIYGYMQGFYKDLKNEFYSDTNQELFVNYKIAICLIYDVTNYSQLSDFYYRVNKFGIKLNRPEILKAQYSETNFQDMINSLADLDSYRDLNLFSDRSMDRMADIDLIGELIGLIEYGIVDKKIAADDLYKQDVSKDKSEAFFSTFNEIIFILTNFNAIYPISKTRYKQRNDFYTLWNFLLENQNMNQDTYNYFYKILVLIGEDINPSNEECPPFMNYAYHCVTQSNSKRARSQRLEFLTDLFLNINHEPNLTQKQILDYYELDYSSIVKIQNYLTISGPKLQGAKGFPQLF